MKCLISVHELPSFNIGRSGILASIFNGGDHRLPGISMILTETSPGDGAPRVEIKWLDAGVPV